jgi:hypothetical protein
MLGSLERLRGHREFAGSRNYVMDESMRFQNFECPLNYGVDWHPCYEEGGDAAVSGIGSGSEVEGGADGLKTGVCAGKDVSGSEETTMEGELWPSGMATMEVMEEADGLFRVGP